MQAIEPAPELLELFRKFLDKKVAANEVVKAIDEFVSSDAVYELPDHQADQILELQDETAFYVQDEGMRAEYSSYFGDDQLALVIEKFLRGFPPPR